MQVGVIGLGAMGRAMADHLLDDGVELLVWNRTAERAEPLAARGARIAASPAQAASPAIVMTSLANDEALEAVLDDLLTGLPPGGTHVSTGTISLALCERLEQAHHAAGQHFVAAPVLGRPPAAAAGKLFVMAAGAPAALTAARPLLDALGQRVFVLGERPSQAVVAKLACNFLIFSTIEQLGEVFALGEKAGIDRHALFSLLTESFFNAPVHKNYGQTILDRSYDGGVPVTLAVKDTRLMLAAGDALGVPLPVASLVRDRLLSAVASGRETKDFALIAQLCAEAAGLTG